MTDPAHRHGGPDAGWYRPGPGGWQRVSDAESWPPPGAVHFMSDPNVDLTLLNTARRWWLDHMPWIGHVPTDDEVLEAYRQRTYW